MKKTREGPNIVQLYEVYEEKHHCCLVMELMRGGELFDRILERKNFSEKEARDCIADILTGLEFLHNKYVFSTTFGGKLMGRERLHDNEQHSQYRLYFFVIHSDALHIEI